MGEKGETPHGRDNEAAAATGPGTKTTDHHRTDGGSLTTPASGPEVDQKVRLDLVKPPPSVESTTPPERTQPHGNGRVVVDRDDDDGGRRARERVDDPAYRADTSTDETAATVTASTSTDAAAPHHAPNTPLKGERSRRELTGEVGARTEVGEGEDGSEKLLPDESSKPSEPTSPPDEAKAPRDQGYHQTTSMSARSTSCDHPDSDENTETSNPTRPSEDPGDVTDDDARHPDEPTEPPDMPEGTRRRGIQEQVETRVSGASRGGAEGTGDDGVETRRPEKPNKPNHEVEGARDEAVETRLLKGSRGAEESPGVDGDEERRPGWPDEPPDKPYGAPREPNSAQVKPGGATNIKSDGDVAHECADATRWQRRGSAR